MSWKVGDGMLQTLASGNGGPVTFASAKDVSITLCIAPEIATRNGIWNINLCSHCVVIDISVMVSYKHFMIVARRTRRVHD